MAQIWPRPLDGVRIIDFSVLVPGPLCTHLLEQMGAEITKVEPPGGDPVRSMNATVFSALNRGKRSVCIDAKTPESREFLLRLIADADVLVEGFRPGVMDALGLGAGDVQARNPRLIYASISGYGQDGPYARRPGHDINFVAAAGYFASTLDLNHETLQRPRLRISDYFASMSTAFAIAALLREPREKRNFMRVDGSMFDTLAYLALPGILSMTEDTDADPRLRADVHADVALYGTADGRAIAIATLEDKFWQTFVSKMSSRFPQLANSVWADRSGRTRDKLRLAAVLREVFQQMTLEEIERCLPADELCWTPVLCGTELLRDPQLVARKLVVNTPWGKEPSSPFAINGRRAPVESPVAELGRDTAALWGKFGMSGPSP